MLEYASGSSLRLPVVLQTSAGAPVPGVVAAGVTFSLVKSNGVNYDISLTSSDWSEFVGTAYVNQGYYNVLLPATYSSDAGILQYCAKVATANIYYGVAKIASGDTTVIYNTIGVPFSGTVAAALTATYIQAVSGANAGAGGFTAADRTMLTDASSTINIVSSTIGLPFSGTVAAALTATYVQSVLAASTSTLTYTRVGVPIGASISADVAAIKNVIGTPAVSTVSVDIAAIKTVIGTPFSGTVAAALTATYHQAALAADVAVAGGFTIADRTMLTDASGTINIVSSTIGLPFSGTVAAALTATYHQAVLGAAGGGGGSGSTDLTPVLAALTATLNRLGVPVVTVSKDIYEVARLVKTKK